MDCNISNLPGLPVKQALPDLLEALSNHSRVVLEAPPGAGKTSLVPLALLGASWRREGKILVLEPRRLATKAAALFMASLLKEEPGATIGYRVKLETLVGKNTIIEVITEGILIRMLQENPTLEDVSAIIFDEFHERSLQADLGLALVLNAQKIIRPDLRVLVMSATLDGKKISKWLEAPLITSQGKLFPVDVKYLSPNEAPIAQAHINDKFKALVPKAVKNALEAHSEGDILVFLPGIREILNVAAILNIPAFEEYEIHTLYGSLPLSQQQAAILPSKVGKRKVILSTSISETSLTIEGVKIVIDAGYSRVPRYNPVSGLTHLATIRVSKAAAEQRRGRAGRLGPGFCYRLWTPAEQLQLPEYQNPEILEADLCSLALELSIWGVKNPNELSWLDMPPQPAMEQACGLLLRLEAILEDKNATEHGKQISKLGLPPRLGHLVIKGNEMGFGATACLLAALLEEKDIIKSRNTHFLPHQQQINPGLGLRLEIIAEAAPAPPGFEVDSKLVLKIKEQQRNLMMKLGLPEGQRVYPDKAGILCSLAYPDRIGKKEGDGKVRIINGQKLNFATELYGGYSFFGIAQLDANNKYITLAAPIEIEELLEAFANQAQIEKEIKWDKATEKVIGRNFTRLGALALEETPLLSLNQEIVADILIEVIKEKGIKKLNWNSSAENLQKRLIFLHHLDKENWPDASDDFLLGNLNLWLRPFISGMKSFKEVEKIDLYEALISLISWEKRTALDTLAPAYIEVPSGSRAAIDYSVPQAPVLAVRLQEVFGLMETPKIGGGKIPLTMHLLSPARRPVQVTQDLKSFWKTGYFEVKKGLKGRYPKHYWPEDPLSATAVKGIKKKNSQP